MEQVMTVFIDDIGRGVVVFSDKTRAHAAIVERIVDNNDLEIFGFVLDVASHSMSRMDKEESIDECFEAVRKGAYEYRKVYKEAGKI